MFFIALISIVYFVILLQIINKGESQQSLRSQLVLYNLDNIFYANNYKTVFNSETPRTIKLKRYKTLSNFNTLSGQYQRY